MSVERGFDLDGINEHGGLKRMKNHILAIGIDNYQFSRQLNNCVNDSKLLTNTLHKYYEFIENNTVELYDGKATRARIIIELDRISEVLNSDDNLLIYYAGHGFFKEKLNFGFLVPVDGRVDSVDSLIPNSLILDYLRGIQAHHIFLIVDSCFSGDFIIKNNLNSRSGSISEVFAERVDRIPSRWGLAAGRIEKVEDGLIGNHSPFNRSLVDYLIHTNAKQFAVSDLITSVCNLTTYNSKQTPIGGPLFQVGHRGGEFVFRKKDVYEGMGNRKRRTSKDKNQDSQFLTEGNSLDDDSNEILESQHFQNVKQYEKMLDELTDKIHKLRISPREILNKLGIEFIEVGSGEFTMGSETGNKDELPVHKVALNSFEISKYPITQIQWEYFMENNPSHFKGLNTENHPVENVSWNDVQVFIEKLKFVTKEEFSLPTEAQWEYAAKGGPRNLIFDYFKDNLTSIEENCWYLGNSKNKTNPIGLKNANILGIHEMCGSVWEWCADWYGGYNYSSEIEPKGPRDGNYKVIRGGSWLDDKFNCRVTKRNFHRPNNNSSIIGFRIIRITA